MIVGCSHSSQPHIDSSNIQIEQVHNVSNIMNINFDSCFAFILHLYSFTINKLQTSSTHTFFLLTALYDDLLLLLVLLLLLPSTLILIPFALPRNFVTNDRFVLLLLLLVLLPFNGNFSITLNSGLWVPHSYIHVY